MILAEAPPVYGYTVFCDDIRTEVGDKLTYVGVYDGRMFVHGTFPFTLPKFAMHFRYFQMRPNIIPATKIIVTMPGMDEENPAFVIDIPATAATENIAANQSDPDQTYIGISGPIVLTNVVISEPGFIAVRAVRGDEYIRLGRLRIEQHPNFKSVNSAEDRKGS